MTGRAASDLPARARAVLRRLPPGAVEAAEASLRRGVTAAGADRPAWATPEAVAHQLVRPLVEVDDWPGPSEPLAVDDGAVHADLIDTDHDLLARLRELLADDGRLTPEVLAAEAQQWRLPVTPYRRLARRPLASPGSPGDRPAPGDRPLAAAVDSPGGPGPKRTGDGNGAGRGWAGRPLVVDLTSLWAGPLATSLLADLGARVVKIDPDCRPDGFRAHPGLYRSLNGAKEITDLDLRRPADRARFEALVAGADLVVDSFSRRVMPNFGYAPDDLRRLNPAVATLSIVAFPAGSPEADWISYGPGVHAASGLADPVLADPVLVGPAPTGGGGAGGGRERFVPAPVAYPDALAGLAAFAAAAELLARRPAGSACRHVEVSLAGALAPLVARARAGPGCVGSRAGYAPAVAGAMPTAAVNPGAGGDHG